MSIAEGTVLSERYKLLKYVGTGGMATVYKAEDVETGEIVALKILKEEYCDNADFIKRFGHEAFAASKLSHANIVSVYEVKNDGNVHYIVMEYVDGITLKDYLQGLSSLQDRDALKITAQILSAVEYAHNNGIIHRDIKPMNIMINKEGVIKLSDFGIARAATGSTISTSDGNVGSVHYISPEQARGGLTDERSDIYSIGITLYEMIMGVVPFDGENVVAVIMKHLKERMVPPKEIDPEIPSGVNDLVLMATMKDPSKRFQSASEMLSRVKKVLENPNESFLSDSSDDDMKIVGKISEKEIKNTVYEKEEDESDEVEYVVSGTDDSLYTNRGERFRNGIISTLTYALAIAAGLFLSIWLISEYKKTDTKMHNLTDIRYSVSDYTNMKAENVVKILEENGLKVKQVPTVVENMDFPDGYILSQSIATGTIVKDGDEITLEVSSQAGSFVLEDYAGQDFRQVNQALVDLDVKTQIKNTESRSVAEGSVIRTSPGAGNIINPGDTVVIFNSSGNLCESFTMPDLKGKTLEEAQRILNGYKLNLKTYEPAPGEDVDIYLGNKTPSPVPTETPEPTPSPIPENPENSETPEIQDETPSPFSSPEPNFTPEPTMPLRIAEEVVVEQFPKAGTEVYSLEDVVLYFYSADELRKVKEMIFNFPRNLNDAGQDIRLRIDAVTSDGDGLNTIVVPQRFYSLSDFPIRYEVPLSMNGGYTTVTVYIDGTKYSEIHVYE